MQHNPIGWVEIPVNDLDRAEEFYEAFFGFKCDRQEPINGCTMSWFPMDMESYGSAATLVKYSEGPPPGIQGPLVYFTAPGGSVEKALEKAQSLGAPIRVSKTQMGEHGFFAVINDSEGNRIAIHSMTP